MPPGRLRGRSQLRLVLGPRRAEPRDGFPRAACQTFLSKSMCVWFKQCLDRLGVRAVDGSTIHYRMADEYGSNTRSEPAERRPAQPLPLGELADFFLAAWPRLEVLESNIDDDVRGMLGLFRARSEFYLDLDKLLRQRVSAAHCVHG